MGTLDVKTTTKSTKKTHTQKKDPSSKTDGHEPPVFEKFYRDTTTKNHV